MTHLAEKIHILANQRKMALTETCAHEGHYDPETAINPSNQTHYVLYGDSAGYRCGRRMLLQVTGSTYY